MSDLTILIPTYKRQHILEKLINYWSNSSFKILILDGSKEKIKNNIANKYSNIDYLHFSYQIEDRECPQGSLYRRFCEGFNKVETKYSLIATDDDFFNIQAIEECLDAIGKNDNFSSFSGFTYSCVFKKRSIKLERMYKNSSFLTSGIKDPDKRAIFFFYYVPRYYYSISNTELSKRIFGILYRYKFLPIFAWVELFYEISMSLISCHNVINSPFCIRGVNTKIERSKKVMDINDCFFEKEISNHLDHLITDLSNMLVKYSNKSFSEIQNYFKFSICAFISYSEINREIKTINTEIKTKLKDKLNLHRLKNYFYKKQNKKYENIYNNLNYNQIEILFSKLKIDL